MRNLVFGLLVLVDGRLKRFFRKRRTFGNLVFTRFFLAGDFDCLYVINIFVKPWRTGRTPVQKLKIPRAVAVPWRGAWLPGALLNPENRLPSGL